MGRPVVFAVEDSAVQVTWSQLPPGTLLSAGDAVVEVADEGPGAAVLTGLPADSSIELAVAEPERPPSSVGFRTLAALPGPERCRVATVSDCHLGGRGFGQLPRLHHPAGAGIHTTCLAAALDEAVAWGADLVVVKGDLTQEGAPGEWEEAASLLGPVVAGGVPVEVIPGNHDRRGDDAAAVARLAEAGVRYTVGGVACRDLPGLRVLAADVTLPGHHGGLAEPVRAELVDLAGEAQAGVLVCIHQQPQRWRRATHWPPGLPGPDAAALLDGLGAAHPATLVTAGHTHRHRRRRHGPLVVTEVGSTKDHPGTWAGYVVTDAGIRQVVRRIAAPDVLRWTEATRTGYLGVWGRWSAWTLSARCFTHRWPT